VENDIQEPCPISRLVSEIRTNEVYSPRPLHTAIRPRGPSRWESMTSPA
jgi:hypothetical protein